MTTIIERVDVDRINARARTVNPVRALVTVIATAIWLIPWLVAKIVGYSWFVTAWVFAAMAEGFTDGFKDTPWGRDRAQRAAAAAIARARARE